MHPAHWPSGGVRRRQRKIQLLSDITPPALDLTAQHWVKTLKQLADSPLRLDAEQLQRNLEQPHWGLAPMLLAIVPLLLVFTPMQQASVPWPLVLHPAPQPKIQLLSVIQH